jgi:hypothetical protein
VPQALGQNKTAATVPFLLQLLPSRPLDSPYVVWLDNLFSSTKLFAYLRELGYGATGTARTNSGICADFVARKQIDKKKDSIPWGTLYSAPTIDNNVLQYAWKDNALVLFLSTTHDSKHEQLVIRHRKRPSKTSSSAKTARIPFGSEPSKDLPIPKFVDDYNDHMGQVDQADQLRATNPGLRRVVRGGWHALWNFIFNVTLVNSFLLSDYTKVRRFRIDLQKALFERCHQISEQQRTFEARSNLERQHHLKSGLPLRYCSVCEDPPSQKRKRSILGEIPGNSRSTKAQKRRKTTFGCKECGSALCKDGNCFGIHCDSV